jgi:FtsP/CotA-like multicopper oxidase with cupredoxin domain
LKGKRIPALLVVSDGAYMSLSRRQFIQASGIALCAGAMPLTASAAGQQQPLPIPPLIESRRGQPLFLTLQRSHWSFTQGRVRRSGALTDVTLGRPYACGMAMT